MLTGMLPIFRLSRCRPVLTVCCMALLCSSCFSTVATQTPREEPPAPRPVVPTDKSLVGIWELIYQVDNKGDQDLPRQKTKLELTDKGYVIFNRTNPQSQDEVKNKTGTYVLRNNEITITDEEGHRANWPYTLTDDILVITMPDVGKKFYWRRIPKPPGT